MSHPQQNLRQQYRQLRRTLTAQQQLHNSFLLTQNINKLLRFKHKLKIAAYLSTQGEISLDPWISQNRQHQIYLPMLYETINPQLRFAPFTPHLNWKQNRFNITEPDTHWSHAIHPRALDIILLPLVAFDKSGNRMGMGGGYYDRSLAFRKSRQHWKKPKLIGVAHSIQQHHELPRQPWDIPLDAVITEKQILHFRNK